MSLVIESLPEAIRNTKQQLRSELTEYKAVFADACKRSSPSARPDKT